jgi:hypothetical protein
MRKELEQRLVERWPTWFNTGGDIRETAMARGFTHGDGWFDILWRLCVDLEPMVAELERAAGRQFEVRQVKEKFGGLRFYVNHANDAIRERIYAAQNESFHTCDICGQPGKWWEHWLQTRCDEHAWLPQTEMGKKRAEAIIARRAEAIIARIEGRQSDMTITVEGNKVILHKDGGKTDIGLPIQDLLDGLGEDIQAKAVEETVYVWNDSQSYVWTEIDGWYPSQRLPDVLGSQK